MERPSRIIDAIRAELGPHLVKSNYRKFLPKDAKPSWGTCYVASEALYHLWGKENGFTPVRIPYKVNRTMNGQHWFLEHRPSGFQVDITADQFTKSPPNRVPDWTKAVPAGFLTKKPSKRAQQIIDVVRKKFQFDN
jgi:hypothetical protein